MRNGSTAAVERFLQAATEERKAMRDLLREHRELHTQNLDLVQELVEQPTCNETEANSSLAEVRYGLLKAENTELVTNYQKVLEENNNLFKLYIASHRLHSTLALGEVIDVISEIILNLIGAERFSLLFFDEPSGQLVPVCVRGIERSEVGAVRIGEGVIGEVMTSRQTYALDRGALTGERDLSRPLAVIPLRVRDSLIGGIVLYSLLSHNPDLRDVDLQLFDYLATHAAMALHSARTYTASERKVSKMKEFLSLMNSPDEVSNGDENSLTGA